MKILLSLLIFSSLEFAQSTPGALGPPFGTGGGTAQVQTVSFPQVWSLAVNQPQVCWTPSVANTGAAPTLTITANGVALAAKPITKLGTTALVANDIVIGAIACVIYDGTQLQLQNPQTASSASALSWNNKICSVQGGAAVTTVTCTPSGYSWASGETIVIEGINTSASTGTVTATDSNSDTFTCSSSVGTAYGAAATYFICYHKVAATITTVTVNLSGTGSFPTFYTQSYAGGAGTLATGAVLASSASNLAVAVLNTPGSGSWLTACVGAGSSSYVFSTYTSGVTMFALTGSVLSWGSNLYRCGLNNAAAAVDIYGANFQ